jgi:hypothetical protein
MHIDKYKQNDGWYLIDGVSYETAESVLGDVLGFCGCGDPESALEYVAKILQAAKEKKIYERWKELFNSEGQGYFVLYTLDNKGVIEHGTSVGSSWLTQKGKELLEDIIELLSV